MDSTGIVVAYKFVILVKKESNCEKNWYCVNPIDHLPYNAGILGAAE